MITTKKYFRGIYCLITAAPLLVVLSCYTPPSLANTTCSFERFQQLKLNEHNKKLHRESATGGDPAEGASSEAYFDDKRLARLKLTQLGETQKTEALYVFATKDDYMGTIIDYLYSSPIYMDTSRVVARIKTSFLVCDGKLQTAVNQPVMNQYVERSEKLLRQFETHRD